MGPDYQAILGTHVQNECICKCTSPIKWGKRENNVGENHPPKREMRKDAWMDGVIKTPPLGHTSMYIQERMEKEKTSYEEKVPPKMEKKEMRQSPP